MIDDAVDLLTLRPEFEPIKNYYENLIIKTIMSNQKSEEEVL